MQALKGSYQPVIALGLLSAVGYGPHVVQDQVTQLLGNNASAVMTNVPGPQQPLYFAGQRIARDSTSGCRSRAASAWASRSSPTTGASSSA